MEDIQSHQYSDIEALISDCEAALRPQFAALDAREERLTERVLGLFAEEQVALRHFNPTNGYGYDDQGRDTLERIYAKLFRMFMDLNGQDGNPLNCVAIWALTDNPNVPKGNYVYNLNSPYGGLVDEKLNYKDAFIRVYETLKQ